MLIYDFRRIIKLHHINRESTAFFAQREGHGLQTNGIPQGVRPGATLSMPGILDRSRIPESAMTQEELQGSQRNADTLKAASKRIGALAA